MNIKENIRPFDAKGQYHGYWERYWPNGLNATSIMENELDMKNIMGILMVINLMVP